MKLHQTILEKEAKRFVDCNGKPIHEGMHVRMLKVPPELLEDLPPEDQEAIVAAARSPLLVSELMLDFKITDIELRFVDKNNVIHFIYVVGSNLEV